MNPKRRYRCDNCGTVWERQTEAARCCPHEADLVFICGVCDKEYEMDEKAQAEQCCS